MASREPLPIADRNQLAGMWANDVDVVGGRHEVTIDFFRQDVRRSTWRVLVARVAMSPRLVEELRELLDRGLDDYTRINVPMSPDEFMRLPVGERLRLIREHRARRWRKSESERRASSERTRELVKLIKASELRWLRERGYGA